MALFSFNRGLCLRKLCEVAPMVSKCDLACSTNTTVLKYLFTQFSTLQRYNHKATAAKIGRTESINVLRSPLYCHRWNNCHITTRSATLCENRDHTDSKKSEAVIGEMKQRLAIIFTCRVCSQRQTKTFSKKAYETGIVIIECEGCKNRHLIADNLGWFNHFDGRYAFSSYCITYSAFLLTN